uniref:Glycosyltransferase WbuB n=1 Tax=Planktothricoides sp. SpSt-374 TaxID=2282167 RepID=A0A7C3ZU85_9CYAN
MNILILNQYGLPRGSAGITRHGDLGSVLVKRGHQVTVIASGFDYLTRNIERTGSQSMVKENYDGVDFIWLKTTTYTANDTRRIRSMVDYSVKAAFACLRLTTKKPDIVVGSSPHPLTGLTSFFLANYYKVPFVLEIRDLWPSILADLGVIKEGGFAYKGLVILEKFLYKNATKIITIPPLAKQRIQELGINPDQATNIPNGIFIDKTKEGKNTEKIPESIQNILDNEKDKKIILYAGAHGVANDLYNVINAADYLRQNKLNLYSKISFIFIGGGQERDKLIQSTKNKQHNNIYFIPPVDKSVIKLVLSHADILLVHVAQANVFKYGLSPNKLYDYLEAGKPILFSSANNFEIINQIEAGLTFAPGKPEELAKAIETMLNIPDQEIMDMGERGKSYVRSHHDWNTLAANFEKVLLEAINPTKTESLK